MNKCSVPLCTANAKNETAVRPTTSPGYSPGYIMCYEKIDGCKTAIGGIMIKVVTAQRKYT